MKKAKQRGCEVLDIHAQTGLSECLAPVSDCKVNVRHVSDKDLYKGFGRRLPLCARLEKHLAPVSPFGPFNSFETRP